MSDLRRRAVPPPPPLEGEEFVTLEKKPFKPLFLIIGGVTGAIVGIVLVAMAIVSATPSTKVMEMSRGAGEFTSQPFTVGDDWYLEYEGNQIYYITAIRDDGIRKDLSFHGSQGRVPVFGAGTYKIKVLCMSENGFRVAAYD